MQRTQKEFKKEFNHCKPIQTGFRGIALRSLPDLCDPCVEILQIPQTLQSPDAYPILTDYEIDTFPTRFAIKLIAV